MKTGQKLKVDIDAPPRALLRLLAEFIVEDYLKEKVAANSETFTLPVEPTDTEKKE